MCTTVRPTQLSYKELYDYDGCAQFVSDYLTFEALDPPIDLVRYDKLFDIQTAWGILPREGVLKRRGAGTAGVGWRSGSTPLIF